MSNRKARHAVCCIGMWERPEDDAEMIEYIRELAEGLQPYAFGSGFYPNYDADSAPGRLEAAFGKEKFEKLLGIKQAYDPDNVFRLNQNIRKT